MLLLGHEMFITLFERYTHTQKDIIIFTLFTKSSLKHIRPGWKEDQRKNWATQLLEELVI